jgi:hypothetical protein
MKHHLMILMSLLISFISQKKLNLSIYFFLNSFSLQVVII